MRSVLITGAAGGIGAALCAAFHAAGFRVIATDIKEAAITGADAFVACDLDVITRDAVVLDVFASSVRATAAGTELAVLVNNAATQVLASTANIGLPDWERSLRVNLTAPFLLTQTFLPELSAAKGTVINIGSVHAQATKPGFVTYATSKAAIHGLTRALAVDLGKRLRVVCVAPAAIATPMLREGFSAVPGAFDALSAAHPLGRIGEPAEVAAAAVQLAQETFLFSTGSVFWLDGGVLSRLHDPI